VTKKTLDVMVYHNYAWGMQKITSHCAQEALSKLTFEKTQNISNI